MRVRPQAYFTSSLTAVRCITYPVQSLVIDALKG